MTQDEEYIESKFEAGANDSVKRPIEDPGERPIEDPAGNRAIVSLTELTQIRQALHRIPEIAFDLPLTSAFIKEKLISYGYEPISVATSGWIALVEGKGSDAIALRADMDGLEVTEANEVSYQSTHPGQMHACGHDGHMTMLLGLAKWLKYQPQPEKTVVMIFQPAEEGPGGARVIMESGILQQYKVSKIYGFHLFPGLPQGILGLTEGPFMARCGEFDIAIKGKGSHAGQAQLGIDALIAGARIIEAVQTIRSRNQDPLRPLVVNIGTMRAGEARNSVAENATLTGTIRSYDEASFNQAVQRLTEIVQVTQILTKTKIVLTVRPLYPEVINDPEMIQGLKAILARTDFEVLEPLMLAEDFSYYQRSIRGAFLFLGTGRDDLGLNQPLHSARFNFDEGVLVKGVEFYQRILAIEKVW
ncbi:MAG: M20 family metallopeptidase [Clostridiaceae bacterium]